MALALEFRLNETVESFTRLERAVIEKLLAEDSAILDLLRQQAAAASVGRREHTGVGFFTEIVLPPSIRRADIARRAHLADVDAHLPNLTNGAAFVLYLQDGLLARLEGYTYDEPWPDRTDQFTLTYRTLPRDLSVLLPDQKHD
jgi:hypothetical protein